MNSVNLTGRITKDVELKTTPSDNKVVSFILAVDRGYKDKDGNKLSDFVPCIAWNNQADFMSKYVKKGNLLEITGTIQVRNYTTSQNENRTLVEVVVDSLSNLTPKPKEENAGDKLYVSPNPNSPIKVNGKGVDLNNVDDDLPF